MSHFDTLVDICLKRGIIYPDSEIHGSLSGFYDYGSIGYEIKRRWEEAWRKHFLKLHPNFHEIQTTTIMPMNVFKASGHLEHFYDPIAECPHCGTKVRADHLLEDYLGEKFEGLTTKELNELMKKHNIVCPKCKKPFKEIENFTLMFSVDVGAGDDKKVAYLRPETAQGPYTAFKREFRANREKLPLGLAIIGKAFRNEISPRQFVIRTREFTQAELQIFFDPESLPEVPFDKIKAYKLRLLPQGEKGIIELTCEEAVKRTGMEPFFIYFMAMSQLFMEKMGLLEHFRFKQLSDEEKAFYNKYHWDLEINMPSFGKWIEVAGFHYRTDHDLRGHAEVSKQKLNIPGKNYVPHVLELSFGVDRNIFALLDCNLKQKKDQWYFALPPIVAPYDVAVFPLVNKDRLPERAREIYYSLNTTFKVFYDDSGSIGRRYARVDEIGVPLAVTVDFQTLEDDTVTLRDRDTGNQIRVEINKLNDKIAGVF
ncbi:MAG: glycine--tRNA ligase [Candidatus Diapherotrites archaeon]|nr:glycine--tRNA ligase [Candidatus Diapherotrites archaeon]